MGNPSSHEKKEHSINGKSTESGGCGQDGGSRYIRMDAAAPPPAGERCGPCYEAQVPATMDLADRADLAIKA